MTYITHGEEETEAVAMALAKDFLPPAVFLLFGDLGAGKTAFTRGLAKGYGFLGRVTSPTFTLMHQYAAEQVTINHWDLYRLADADELYDIGFDEFCGSGVSVVEWPDKFLDDMPDGAVWVTIKKNGEESREITVEERGKAQI